MAVLIKIQEDCKPELTIPTTGYVIAFMEGSKFKFTGSIEIASLAPLLLKIMADKMGAK